MSSSSSNNNEKPFERIEIIENIDEKFVIKFNDDQIKDNFVKLLAFDQMHDFVENINTVNKQNVFNQIITYCTYNNTYFYDQEIDKRLVSSIEEKYELSKKILKSMGISIQNLGELYKEIDGIIYPIRECSDSSDIVNYIFNFLNYTSSENQISKISKIRIFIDALKKESNSSPFFNLFCDSLFNINNERISIGSVNTMATLFDSSNEISFQKQIERLRNIQDNKMKKLYDEINDMIEKIEEEKIEEEKTKMIEKTGYLKYEYNSLREKKIANIITYKGCDNNFTKEYIIQDKDENILIGFTIKLNVIEEEINLSDEVPKIQEKIKNIKKNERGDVYDFFNKKILEKNKIEYNPLNDDENMKKINEIYNKTKNKNKKQKITKFGTITTKEIFSKKPGINIITKWKELLKNEKKTFKSFSTTLSVSKWFKIPPDKLIEASNWFEKNNKISKSDVIEKIKEIIKKNPNELFIQYLPFKTIGDLAQILDCYQYKNKDKDKKSPVVFITFDRICGYISSLFNRTFIESLDKKEMVSPLNIDILTYENDKLLEDNKKDGKSIITGYDTISTYNDYKKLNNDEYPPLEIYNDKNSYPWDSDIDNIYLSYKREIRSNRDRKYNDYKELLNNIIEEIEETNQLIEIEKNESFPNEKNIQIYIDKIDALGDFEAIYQNYIYENKKEYNKNLANLENFKEKHKQEIRNLYNQSELIEAHKQDIEKLYNQTPEEIYIRPNLGDGWTYDYDN